MSKWILCKDDLPPINTNVLIFTGESSYPYDIRKYNGKNQREVSSYIRGAWKTNTEIYDEWLDNHGGVYSKNPVAWQFIDNFMKEGEIWVEGRVV